MFSCTPAVSRCPAHECGMIATSLSSDEKKRSGPVRTWWRHGGNGLAHRAADAGRPSRVEQNGPACVAHDLALHSCNWRRRRSAEWAGNSNKVRNPKQPDRRAAEFGWGGGGGDGDIGRSIDPINQPTNRVPTAIHPLPASLPSRTDPSSTEA
jgi:hypothetical protein